MYTEKRGCKDITNKKLTIVKRATIIAFCPAFFAPALQTSSNYNSEVSFKAEMVKKIIRLK
jgi:hypothetical protein